MSRTLTSSSNGHDHTLSLHELDRVRCICELLAHRHPFWHGLSRQMRVVLHPQLPAVAATDGLDSLAFNPVYTRALTESQVAFCLAMSLAGVALDTAQRGVGRDPEAWAEACLRVLRTLLLQQDKGVAIQGDHRTLVYADIDVEIPGVGHLSTARINTRDDQRIEDVYEDVLDEWEAAAQAHASLCEADDERPGAQPDVQPLDPGSVDLDEAATQMRDLLRALNIPLEAGVDPAFVLPVPLDADPERESSSDAAGPDGETTAPEDAPTSGAGIGRADGHDASADDDSGDGDGPGGDEGGRDGDDGSGGDGGERLSAGDGAPGPHGEMEPSFDPQTLKDITLGPDGAVFVEAEDPRAREAMAPPRSLMAALARHAERSEHTTSTPTPDDAVRPGTRRPPQSTAARRALRRARNLRRAEAYARATLDTIDTSEGREPGYTSAPVVGPDTEENDPPRGQALPAPRDPRTSPSTPDPVTRLIPDAPPGRCPAPPHLHLRRAGGEDELSFSRPNRRRLAMGMVVPRTRSERVQRMVVAIDTSGSVKPHQLAVFRRELAVLREQADDLTVIFCDYEVRNVLRGDELSWWLATPDATALGGGKTTNHLPMFDYVASRRLDPGLLVAFTDIDTFLPEQPPNYPVLWVCSGEPRRDPHFGTVLTIPSPPQPHLPEGLRERQPIHPLEIHP